jgi:hypothetical protein
MRARALRMPGSRSLRRSLKKGMPPRRGSNAFPFSSNPGSFSSSRGIFA